MSLVFWILFSVCAMAHGEAERTVRAEPIKPVPGIGTASRNMYQIEIGHKGVLKGSLPDIGTSSDHPDEVVTLSGHLQVLRIQQEEPVKQGSGYAVVGVVLFLASFMGIAMKLHEYEDPYADLRGSKKPLTWVRMSIHSSMEAWDEDSSEKIKKHAQEMVNGISFMASKALRKIHAKMRRLARPNIAKYDLDENHRDCTPGIQFVPTDASDEPMDVLGNSEPPMLMPVEPRPSELANLTMEALAKQLEGAGQDELAAQMLSNSSKSLAMGQMRSNTTVEENIDCESESECVI